MFIKTFDPVYIFPPRQQSKSALIFVLAGYCAAWAILLPLVGLHDGAEHVFAVCAVAYHVMYRQWRITWCTVSGVSRDVPAYRIQC